VTAHIASSRRSDAHEPAAQGRYTQHPLLASRAALSRREVADLLGISLRTVDNWVSQGPDQGREAQ
jgi:DNA-binding transcriptional regulator YiaG